MRIRAKLFMIMAILVISAAAFESDARSVPDDQPGTIVIVFKDGSQRSFQLADIARIEFHPVVGGSATAGRARFLGRWKLGDGAGGTFIATLKPDGVASKDRGSSPKGTWTVVGGEARIKWDDGWLDVIRKVDGKYRKVAFAPGTSYTDKPHNIDDAEYLESN